MTSKQSVSQATKPEFLNPKHPTFSSFLYDKYKSDNDRLGVMHNKFYPYWDDTMEVIDRGEYPVELEQISYEIFFPYHASLNDYMHGKPQIYFGTYLMNFSLGILKNPWVSVLWVVFSERTNNKKIVVAIPIKWSKHFYLMFFNGFAVLKKLYFYKNMWKYLTVLAAPKRIKFLPSPSGLDAIDEVNHFKSKGFTIVYDDYEAVRDYRRLVSVFGSMNYNTLVGMKGLLRHSEFGIEFIRT